MISHHLVRSNLGPTDGTERIWRYNCELGTQHIDATILPYIKARNVRENYELWANTLGAHDDPLGHVATWIDTTIKQIPRGVDVARDVDSGGNTVDYVMPTMFSAWVALGMNTHARFSQSRTAMHNDMRSFKGSTGGGALRSPVMGGVALEATNDPNSLDPRDAVTLAIYQFSKDEDARYPWRNPRQGRVFDMTEFIRKPYFVGPLSNGHPNEVTNPLGLQQAVDAATMVLRLTVESALIDQGAQ